MFFSKKLKKFKNINHCFFSKNAGYSKGIYKSLNCGLGSKDSKKNIIKNLAFVSKKLQLRNNSLKLMYQTHSNRVIEINKKNKYLKRFRSDAIITKIKGLALGVVTADCVPIIIYSPGKEIIGCVHAGWKGASAGIIENTIKKLRKISLKNEIFAAIGPCIGTKSYEVDINFYRKFLSKSKKNFIYFVRKDKNKKLFNLRKYVNDKLIKLKVRVDHINKDTFRETTKFFSYRRSQKLGHSDYGRCISVIALTKFSQN